MITKFQTIKKIGCFDDFESKDIKDFNKVNLFFGNNGCGKTTISNLLYLLSKHCKDKQEMFKEFIDHDSELQITTEKGTITKDNIIKKDADLYVFNSKFIADSVYNGTSANVDSFSNQIKLTNKKIEEIESKLTLLTGKRNKLSVWNSKINDTIEKIWKKYNEEFQSKIANARLTGYKPPISYRATGNIETFKAELNKLYWIYDNIEKQATTISRLESFKLSLDRIRNLEIDFEKVKTELSISISSSAKEEIGNRINNLQQFIELKEIENKIGDLNDWYRKGNELLQLSYESDYHCPLCGTDLTSNLEFIISNYSKYFSNAIINLFTFLDECILSLESLLKNNFLDNNSKESLEIIDKCSLYDIQLGELKTDSFELIIIAIQELIADLKRKKQTPDEVIIPDQETLSFLTKLKESIDSFKDASRKAIENEINELKKKNPDHTIKAIKEKIKEIAT